MAAAPTRAAPAAGYDVARFTLAAIAALLIAYAGLQMVTIESIAGDTIAEAFYNAVGILCFGLAFLAVAVGLRKA